ncbi:MAG: toprim domain-containing protein [Agathobaculum butyriciproducens]
MHLDNDRVGRQAAESIMGGLDKKYTVLNRPPRAGKDVNDYLRMEIVNRNGKERER